MYKALAHANKCMEAEASHETTSCSSETEQTPSETSSKCLEEQATGFEAKAAAVSVGIKLVVKHTFFDVEDTSEDSSSEEEISLPAAFFKTTEEIDGWRRDYRKFRLGHHQGAKGEVRAQDLALDRRTALDLRSCVDMHSVCLGSCAAISA
jgi:hypothetical protein